MAAPVLGPPGPSLAPRREPSLLLIGTDFRCSPLELREKVAYGAQDGEDLRLTIERALQSQALKRRLG